MVLPTSYHTTSNVLRLLTAGDVAEEALPWQQYRPVTITLHNYLLRPNKYFDFYVRGAEGGQAGSG